MLTSYLVKCPHIGCNWTGRLLPSCDSENWRGDESITTTVVFLCPHCQREWRAEVIGGQVEPLSVDELEPVAWPPVDIGVGD